MLTKKRALMFFVLVSIVTFSVPALGWRQARAVIGDCGRPRFVQRGLIGENGRTRVGQRGVIGENGRFSSDRSKGRAVSVGPESLIPKPRPDAIPINIP